MRSNTQNIFSEIKNAIEDSSNIVVAGHINTDGDALGSMLALCHSINENTSAKATPYLREDIPPSLKFLEEGEKFLSEIKEFPDLIIGVDYGDFERLDLPEDKIGDAKIITFDHHEEHKQRGDISFIDTNYSSTCEMVYNFLKFTGWSIPKKAATCIATGIITDTGHFAHQLFPDTLRAMGDLLEMGTSLESVHANTFMKPVRVMNAWGEILGSASLDSETEMVYAHVPFKKFEEHGIVLDDLEGLKDILKHAQEASFSLLLMEYEHGRIKGSLRSARGTNVFKIADRLGGGGHKYASAFKFENTTLEEVHKKVIEVTRDVLAKSI